MTMTLQSIQSATGCTSEEIAEFVQAYIATSLWSSLDNDQPLDSNHDEDDIDRGTATQMCLDCVNFLLQNARTIQEAIDKNAVRFGPDYGPWGRAGHDFWLTRNGHGAGFWDGDWDEPFDDQLTAAAKRFGECNLYVGDNGKIYC